MTSEAPGHVEGSALAAIFDNLLAARPIVYCLSRLAVRQSRSGAISSTDAFLLPGRLPLEGATTAHDASVHVEHMVCALTMLGKRCSSFHGRVQDLIRFARARFEASPKVANGARKRTLHCPFNAPGGVSRLVASQQTQL